MKLLALALRFRVMRRVLGHFRLPRREHLDRMSRDDLLAYVRAIGLEEGSRAALAAYRRRVL